MDAITKLACAIATAEGWFNPDPTVLPRRNNNPGNLRASPLDRVKNKGYVVFGSPEEGIAGLYHQIAKHILRGYSLRKLIEVWAPPNENNTANYLAETVRRTGFDPEVPLWRYLTMERMS